LMWPRNSFRKFLTSGKNGPSLFAIAIGGHCRPSEEQGTGDSSGAQMAAHRPEFPLLTICKKVEAFQIMMLRGTSFCAVHYMRSRGLVRENLCPSATVEPDVTVTARRNAWKSWLARKRRQHAEFISCLPNIIS
jgi:hypothetical protein